MISKYHRCLSNLIRSYFCGLKHPLPQVALSFSWRKVIKHALPPRKGVTLLAVAWPDYNLQEKII